jgi:hypothetical protein
MFRNTNHPDLPYDYARGVLGESAPQPPYNHIEEDDLFRPDTPPARQPSLPPGHEYENTVEYAGDVSETRSDFPAPPDHAALASDNSPFNRSGVDLRITSDTALLFPHPNRELGRVSKKLKREAMDTDAALAMRSPTHIPHPLNPSTQSHIPCSPGPNLQPEPQHLVPPLPVLRTPSPLRVVLSRKRKRFSAPEDKEDDDSENLAGPSAKRRKLIDQQLSWDFQGFQETVCLPSPSRVDPPTRENSPEPLPQPADERGPLLPTGPSQVQKEDSEIERSRVIEMLSQVVEQGESEDEGEPTGLILAGLSRNYLPALTAGSSQAIFGGNIQSKAETPAKPQVSTDDLAPVPEDVFGPIVFSAKASKISHRLSGEVPEKDVEGGIVVSDPELEIADVSHKSTRFSPNSKAEKKEYKVFRKTPIRPRVSSRVIEVENALAAEAEAEGRDALKPLPSPKKKRATRARTRKQKATPPIEPAIDLEDGPPSISASGPPSKLRRGRSALDRSQAPLLKTPVSKSTRIRKKI